MNGHSAMMASAINNPHTITNAPTFFRYSRDIQKLSRKKTP
jgi:hypothetical protein